MKSSINKQLELLSQLTYLFCFIIFNKYKFNILIVAEFKNKFKINRVNVFKFKNKI